MGEQAGQGHIPVLLVRGQNLPETWEKAIIAVWEKGADVRTEYDRPGEPPSKDATLIVEVAEPLGEPRIHKNFPGGPEELEVYRQEVVEGIHDHWIDPADPFKWTYTYHERVFAYTPKEALDDPEARHLKTVNQIEYIINKAAETPYSRRIQAITWMPTADPGTAHPPCLQRLWFRILMDADGHPVLNLNTHWRSRDGYKAWFMNAFAVTDLQRDIAAKISAKIGQPVKLGRYMDICDSFHIYGSDLKNCEREFQKMKSDPDYRKRSWPSDHTAVKAIFEETRQKLVANPDYMKGKSA